MDVFDYLLSQHKYEPTKLPQDQEQLFLKEFTSSEWYKDFVNRYKEQPALNGDYDYRGAWVEGILPKKAGEHGYSRTPKGRWLKNPRTHPTAWKELFVERFGYDPDKYGITREIAAEMFK